MPPMLSPVSPLISIHAPREGSDGIVPVALTGYREFQSTLPVRGATLTLADISAPEDISIHAPREGSDFNTGNMQLFEYISIHAPREGSDLGGGVIVRAQNGISIHAPREGSDGQTVGAAGLNQDFNPRSP